MAFTYAPLEGDNAFRLLRLIGGKGDLVECELFHADSNDSKLRYEAVSYCWGSEQHECAILIDGKTLTVRGSLVGLLKQLRHHNPRKYRTIWIDAVCIDQENKSEQGHQVQQMRRIYASARRVVFWLGELTPGVKLLMIALNAFNKSVKSFGWHRLDIVREISWERVVNTMEKNPYILDALGRMRAGLHDLLKRPWFRRAWIIQEVANARRGIVQCGKMEIACRPFTLAPLLLRIAPNPHCRNVLDAMPTRLRTTSWWSDDRDLFSIIQKFHYSESTLDRDRIYALRGLCTFRDDKTFLSVDYEQPIQHVINDTISHMFLCDRHCLPDSLYSSMGTFLNDLESTHLRVLIALLKSEDLDGVRNILLRHSTSTKISPLMLSHAVAGRVHGLALTESLLDFCKGQIEISDSMVMAACQNEGHGTALAKLLLDLCKGQIKISEPMVLAACKNEGQGTALTKLLLESGEGQIGITESMILAACKNKEQSAALTELLLELGKGQIEITESMVLAACESRSHGSAMIDLLLSSAQDISPSPDIFIASARNHAQAGPIMSTLIKHFRPSKDIATPELIYTIAVNQRARSEVIHVMSQELGIHVEINEDVAVVAARNKDDLMSLDAFFQSGQLIVTERIFLAATRNLEMGPRVMKYLLQSTPQSFKITDRLVEMMIDGTNDSFLAVIGFVESSSFVALRVLLDHRNEEISITDLVLMSILRNRNAVRILDLFQTYWGLLRISRRDPGVAGPEGEVSWDQILTKMFSHPTGYLTLWWVIKNNQVFLLEVLIKEGLDISLYGTYFTIRGDGGIFPWKPQNSRFSYPLYLACEVGDLSIIKLLLDNGADINQSPSPLIAAMGRDHIFKFLLEHGAQINGDLLMGAHFFRNVPFVELALQYSTQREIDYCLIRAVQHLWVSVTIVQLLLKAGARINVQIRQLSAYEADGKNGGGYEPLHWAVDETFPNMDLVELLLQNGARVDAKTSSGKTPLWIAAKRLNWDLYKRLLEAGADESNVPEEERMRGPPHSMADLMAGVDQLC
ncbi:hypothetical protein G7054_g12027 [Neopestalotiopsis clavispora]|nr:hypothetical protein G7054_g12027 [Neopestalotiopsis clavispora]